MKIGIITIQKCDNFGADLQAYALGAKLRSLGYEAENIDYLFYKHPRHLKSEKLEVRSEKLRNISPSRYAEKPVLTLSLINRIKEKLFPIVASLRSFKHLNIQTFKRSSIARKRREKFAKWFKANVPCGHEYRSVASLYADPPQYDVYMVGSDQVWNPRMGSNILPYFLDFVPAGARCVSYASSIGVSELPSAAFLKYREWLKKFSHIGLREARGVELIKRMKLEAELQHCVDPTLLLTVDEWEKVSSVPDGIHVQTLNDNSTIHSSTSTHDFNSNANPYLLLYDLIACEDTVALAKKIATKRGLKIVRIGDGAYGPGEFVWLFAHADYVVTNSFHGTVFSILHHKLFNTVIPKTMGNASRITSLLESVGLLGRMVRGGGAKCLNVGMGECWNGDCTREIDYDAVEVKLGALRAVSVDFLTRSIAGEKRVAPRKPIGNLPKVCYAVWNPDLATRSKSTSGGLFTILAEETLKNGGVVYGAAFDPDYKHVHHVAAETAEQLEPIRKSKYVWSDATEAIKKAVGQLKAGREVLFTGCPCQCAAMKSAAKDWATKLMTVDFVCHGTPLPEVFAAYVDELERRHGAKVTRYEFRNKDNGWNFPSIYYEFGSGKKCRIIPWLDPFFHGFSVNVFLRSGCYGCPYATLERVSDITIADCWRVAASHPQWDDNHGTSLVLGNTEKGLGRLKSCGVDQLPGGEYPLELAERRNAALMQPAARMGFERQFAEIFAVSGSFEQASAIYMTWKRMVKYWVIYWIKRYGWFYFKHHQ